MPSIHQCVAGFSHGDAISNEALVMRDIFRSWGYASTIFSEAKRILPELRKEAGDVFECRDACTADDIVLLHLSMGSPVNQIFAELPCKKAILYHNVTPPEFFAGVQEQTAHHLITGREQVKQLSGTADLVMADSAFNTKELNALGYENVHVLPLILDLGKLRVRSHRKTFKQYDDELINILFVGRCVPNKRLEDCLSAFYFFQKFVQPASRFIHVGSFAGTEQYHALLLTFLRDLQLEHVDFLGSMPQDQLNACYQCTDLFLCMSEHEGFCIPLLEAMVHKVPILAYDAGAVSETLDGAGVLFKEKKFDYIAEMMGRLTGDKALRQTIIQGQEERIRRYENRNLEQELRKYMDVLLR
ncbi:MAG: glycosyltransferase [Kiritimatiellae bacterium]|nr:glycosyltransferase [Kiritimatiellia bacterium]